MMREITDEEHMTIGEAVGSVHNELLFEYAHREGGADTIMQAHCHMAALTAISFGLSRADFLDAAAEVYGLLYASRKPLQ
jgi:hypothetical protein